MIVNWYFPIQFWTSHSFEHTGISIIHCTVPTTKWEFFPNPQCVCFGVILLCLNRLVPPMITSPIMKIITATFTTPSFESLIKSFLVRTGLNTFRVLWPSLILKRIRDLVERVFLQILWSIFRMSLMFASYCLRSV